MTEAPQRLPEIVEDLHPWLRARVVSIAVLPLTSGGWSAVLSYAHHTAPPPSGAHIPAGNAEYPGDTHHLLDLPIEQPEPDLLAQVKELEATGQVGTLHLKRLPSTMTADAGGSPACSLAAVHPGWVITTHAGEAEAHEWRRRIGQKRLPGQT